MPGSIEFEMHGDSEIVAKLKGRRDRIFAELTKSLNDVNIQLKTHIKRDKLEGQVLHHRRGFLTNSIVQKPATVEGNTITGKVESAGVKYAKIHEYGGTFNIPEHDAHWKHGPGRGRSARVSSWSVSAHTATYPERSFMRSSFLEFRDRIESAIRAGVSRATS